MTYQGKEVFTSDDFDYAAAKPGDYVEEAVVDAAMNCLPPICMSSACAQMGDPYGMRQDPTTGAWRSTYATFKRCLDVSGIWEYCGHCFSGETIAYPSGTFIERRLTAPLHPPAEEGKGAGSWPVPGPHPVRSTSGWRQWLFARWETQHSPRQRTQTGSY